MTDQEAAGSDSPGPKTEEARTVAGSKSGPPWFTLVWLLGAVLMFVYYVVADRLTPYTDLARVHAFVIPVVPEVNGSVVEVIVTQDAVVRAGTPLFRIDETDYQLAVEAAEAELEQVAQTVSADEAGLKSAVAKLSEAEANLRNTEKQSSRVLALTEKNLLPAAEADTAQAALVAAQAKVKTAKAELDRNREQLGATGVKNARVEQALTKLEKARLDLNRTLVTAPSFGVVTNLNIDEGYYARAGQALMTFIAAGNIWIEADIRENGISNIKVGDRADLVLDIDPGTLHSGHIRTVGFGVKEGQETSLGVLPQISSRRGWLRDAQRFPVLIQLDDQAALMRKLRVGGQANVIVYTGEHPLFNRLARWRIFLVSWFSFVY